VTGNNVTGNDVTGTENDRGDVVELLVYHKEKPLYITQVFVVVFFYHTCI
jgi:hypothetical protein